MMALQSFGASLRAENVPELPMNPEQGLAEHHKWSGLKETVQNWLQSPEISLKKGHSCNYPASCIRSLKYYTQK